MNRMGNSGYGFIGLDTHQQCSAVGVCHGEKARDNFSTEILFLSSVRPATAMFVGAQEIQELSAFLLKQESNCVGVHSSGS